MKRLIVKKFLLMPVKMYIYAYANNMWDVCVTMITLVGGLLIGIMDRTPGKTMLITIGFLIFLRALRPVWDALRGLTNWDKLERRIRRKELWKGMAEFLVK